MRVLLTLAVLTLGIAGLTPARAADLVEQPDSGAWPDGGSYVGGGSHGVRALPVVLYDYEPGVGVRHYWLSPWRHRHYFPVTGKRPRVGRHEYFSITGPKPKPAQSYYRFWSNTELVEYDQAPAHQPVHPRALDDEGMRPRNMQPVQP